MELNNYHQSLQLSEDAKRRVRDEQLSGSNDVSLCSPGPMESGS